MRNLLVMLVLVTASTTAFAEIDDEQLSAPQPRPTLALEVVERAPALSPPSLTPAVAMNVDERTPTSTWYGWQILLADGAALGLAAASQNGDLALSWVVTGTVIHGAHGNVGRAVGSLALRGLTPIAGAYLGYALETADGCHSEFCGHGGASLGGLAGVVTAEIVDVALAKDVEVPAATRHDRVGLTPVVHAKGGNVGLGVIGQF